MFGLLTLSGESGGRSSATTSCGDPWRPETGPEPGAEMLSAFLSEMLDIRRGSVTLDEEIRSYLLVAHA